MACLVPACPGQEKYNLDIQIRKASVSATAHISEGYGRFHYQEGIQFYRISRASLFERKDHLISCYDFGYISKKLLDEGKSLIEEAKKRLNGYINYVRRQLRNKV
ncbi:MAG: four helix bundle protein [bacterium]